MRRTGVRGIGAALFAALSLMLATAGTAGAAPALPSQDPFYSYGGSLSSVAPGTVLRQRSVTIAEGGNTTPVIATQILYRTTGELGAATATVTTVLRPATGALPTTPRLVAYQTAYDGLGGQCDPSYTLQGGNSGYSTAQDEEQIILAYVASGDTVIVPDYEGENLDWAAGQESGYGTLDAIRATEHALSAPASTPVGMVGYSGGSIATDFAAELAPSYAPELKFAATAIGGVPVDFLHNLAYINGSPGWSGIIPAVFLSLSRAFNLDLGQYLSPLGVQLTSQDAHGCINDFYGTQPGLTYQQLFKPQYQDVNQNAPFVSITDKLIMGRTGTPHGPMMIGVGNADGTGDGVMIAGDDQELAHEYCSQGVPVQFSVYSGDDHTNAAVPFEVAAKSFIDQSLSGTPATNGCASIAAGNSLAPQPLPPSAPPKPKPSQGQGQGAEAAVRRARRAAPRPGGPGPDARDDRNAAPLDHLGPPRPAAGRAHPGGSRRHPHAAAVRPQPPAPGPGALRGAGHPGPPHAGRLPAARALSGGRRLALAPHHPGHVPGHQRDPLGAPWARAAVDPQRRRLQPARVVVPRVAQRLGQRLLAAPQRDHAARGLPRPPVELVRRGDRLKQPRVVGLEALDVDADRPRVHRHHGVGMAVAARDVKLGTLAGLPAGAPAQPGFVVAAGGQQADLGTHGGGGGQCPLTAAGPAATTGAPCQRVPAGSRSPRITIARPPIEVCAPISVSGSIAAAGPRVAPA